MTPITETIQISIQMSNTAFISVTSTFVTSDTLVTNGVIYLPSPAAIYDPMSILSSLVLFLFIGAGIGKPTLLILCWVGLSIFGVFSGQSAYWSFSLLAILSSLVLYKFVKGTQEV